MPSRRDLATAGRTTAKPTEPPELPAVKAAAPLRSAYAIVTSPEPPMNADDQGAQPRAGDGQEYRNGLSPDTAAPHHQNGSGEAARPDTRVLIVSGEKALRDGLCGSLLSAALSPIPVDPEGLSIEPAGLRQIGCAVVGIAGPDDHNAFGAMRALFAADFRVAVIAVGRAGCTESILASMRAGARDYLSRPVQIASLLECVHRHLDGSAREQSPATPNPPPGFSLLSDREREVLDLVVQGHSTKQIAAQLGRVEKTVEYHRTRIMGKLGVNTAVQLVRLVTLHGWSRSPAPSVALQGTK